MKHSIIYKNKNKYASFPILDYKDGILYIGFFTASYVDHLGVNDWKAWMSFNDGDTWVALLKNQHKFSCFVNIPRKIYDMYFSKTENGLISTGSLGIYKNKNKYKFISGYFVFQDTIEINKPITKQVNIPQLEYLFSFPRHLEISKGHTVLVPMYGKTKLGDENFILKTSNYGKYWEFNKMFPFFIEGNEMAFIELKNKNILALIRQGNMRRLIQSISKDKGKTWSYPVVSDIKGFPPHLLRLKDDRILCTVCDRKIGRVSLIQAYISDDEGETWKYLKCIDYSYTYSSKLHKIKWWKNTKNYRDKLGWNDVGYPVSIQLKDNSIFTVYYITRKDRITCIESCNWGLFN